jgi:hypothetical protein
VRSCRDRRCDRTCRRRFERALGPTEHADGVTRGIPAHNFELESQKLRRMPTGQRLSRFEYVRTLSRPTAARRSRWPLPYGTPCEGRNVCQEVSITFRPLPQCLDSATWATPV